MTLGKARRDEHGRVTNAVLLLHATGSSGRTFLTPRFAGVLFGKGQLLDATRYYIIMPDAIGHGASSKPSDGLHAHFPQYNYADMVSAQYALLTQSLNVDHLRLILGASMGCMHTFLLDGAVSGFHGCRDAARLPSRADRRPRSGVARSA